MKVWASVITVPTSDTPGTVVYVHFDNRRYLFGRIAEGTQRAFTDHKLRQSKVEHIFLTGPTGWSNFGGLTGYLLSSGDQRAATDRPVTLHGGDNILHTIAATRSFVFRGQLRLKVNEAEQDSVSEVLKDNNVIVKALRVNPSGESTEIQATKKRTADETQSRTERLAILDGIVKNMFATQQSINKENEFDEVDPLVVGGSRSKRARTSKAETVPDAAGRKAGDPAAVQVPLPHTTPSRAALSYIMTMHDTRGKFLPQRAKELGVPEGPMFRKLSLGESVTTPSGRVVHPNEVMEPPVKGTGIAVCDLPGVEYLEEFTSHRLWTENTEVLQKEIESFFWILGPGVSSDPKFAEFMKRFPGSKHVVAAADVCQDEIYFRGAAKYATRLNHLDPVFFPPLQVDSSPRVQLPESALRAEPGIVVDVRPQSKLNPRNLESEQWHHFDASKTLSPAEAGADFLAIAVETKQSLAQSPTEAEAFPGSDAEVWTLGTGSALPSKTRNVSCTLITIPGKFSIVLDCGEGSVGQMNRVLGKDCNDRLLDIRLLYISHLHADHHLGSITLIKAVRKALRNSGQEDRKFYIVAPNRFRTWLSDYSSVEDIGMEHLVFISNEMLRPASSPTFIPTDDMVSMMEELGIEQWETAPAHHCQSSFTTAVTFSSGFKLAYSGDTRPTQAFVRIGKNATLLVHEATFNNDELEQAVEKRHSTIKEAIEAGQQMGARKTALIHFSQRYPKLPTLDDSNASDVVYGFDYMRFKVGEINRFQRLRKGLVELYKELEAEEE